MTTTIINKQGTALSAQRLNSGGRVYRKPARDELSVVSTPAPWTAREAELLAVTLRLLQQHGYDRLTVAAVAAETKASKATVYRRWPSKAALVLAAFIQGVSVSSTPPRTGSLRGDLLEIGAQVSKHAQEHSSTMRAVLPEMWRIPELSAAMDEFLHQRKLLMTEILNSAVDRGEIDPAVISDETSDVLPGYLVFRFLMPGRPPTAETVRALVDNVLLPGLTQRTGNTFSVRDPK